MKPIDISGTGGLSTRAVSATASPVQGSAPVRVVRSRDSDTDGAGALSLLSAGDEPPMDAERVEQIRKAIEDGSYPILPTRVADALIAAGYLLRIKQ